MNPHFSSAFISMIFFFSFLWRKAIIHIFPPALYQWSFSFLFFSERHEATSSLRPHINYLFFLFFRERHESTSSLWPNINYLFLFFSLVKGMSPHLPSGLISMIFFLFFSLVKGMNPHLPSGLISIIFFFSFLWWKAWIHIFPPASYQWSFSFLFFGERHESTSSLRLQINYLFLFFSLVKGMNPHLPSGLISIIFFFSFLWWKAWIHIFPPASYQLSFSFLFFGERHESTSSLRPHINYLFLFFSLVKGMNPHLPSGLISMIFFFSFLWWKAWIHIFPPASYQLSFSFLFFGESHESTSSLRLHINDLFLFFSLVKGMNPHLPSGFISMIFFFSFLWWKAWIHIFPPASYQWSFSFLFFGERHESSSSLRLHINYLFLFFSLVKGMNPHLPFSLISMIFFFSFLWWKAWIHIFPPASYQWSFSFLFFGERHESTSSLRSHINDLFLFFSLVKGMSPHLPSGLISMIFFFSFLWWKAWIHIFPPASYQLSFSFLFFGESHESTSSLRLHINYLFLFFSLVKGMNPHLPSGFISIIFFFSFLWWKAWIHIFPPASYQLSFSFLFFGERHESTSSLRPHINDLFLFFSLVKGMNPHLPSGFISIIFFFSFLWWKSWIHIFPPASYQWSFSFLFFGERHESTSFSGFISMIFFFSFLWWKAWIHIFPPASYQWSFSFLFFGERHESTSSLRLHINYLFLFFSLVKGMNPHLPFSLISMIFFFSFLWWKAWIHIFPPASYQWSFSFLFFGERHESTSSLRSHINDLFLFFSLVKGMSPHLPSGLISMIFFFSFLWWKAWIHIFPPASYQWSFSFLFFDERHESTSSLRLHINYLFLFFSLVKGMNPHLPSGLISMIFFFSLVKGMSPHLPSGLISMIFFFSFLFFGERHESTSSLRPHINDLFLFFSLVKGMSLHLSSGHISMIFFFSFLWWKAWIHIFPRASNQWSFSFLFFRERHESISSCKPHINALFLFSLRKGMNPHFPLTMDEK